MNRKIAAVLATVCFLMAGCRDNGNVIMTYGDSVITENIFQYYLSYYKNIYLDTYTDMKDTPSYYNTVLDNGQTAEEYLFNMTVENVEMTLICMELFDQFDLVLDSRFTESIDAYVQELVTEYAGGDKKALNAELATYGVNVDMLSDIYMNQEKSAFVYDYLYGENGTQTVTDADKHEFYQENYVRIRHIYINDAYYYPLDEEGHVQYDNNGNILSAELTAEMAAEKKALVDAVDTALNAGEDFHTVYEMYSEDQYYENGYYLTRNTDFIPEIVASAFMLEEGEQKKIVSDYGTHYILRLPLDTNAYDNEENLDFFGSFEIDLKSHLFMEYVRSFLPDVTVDTEALSAYSVEKSSVNYRF